MIHVVADRMLRDHLPPLPNGITVSWHDGHTISRKDLAKADALLVRSITPINASLLAGTPVAFVGTATAGVDHIDLDYLAQSGIGWTNAPGSNADAVGDYVLAALSHLYTTSATTPDPAHTRIGVVGCGHVGGRLTKRLNALGYQVITCDPPRAARDPFFDHVDLQALIPQCDIICLHLPLVGQPTSEPAHDKAYHPTYHLIDTHVLDQMKPTAWLINAGRGATIDTQHLTRWRRLHPYRRLVLDVFEHEPSIDWQLAAACDLATPHIAGHSLEAKHRGAHFIAQQLCAHFNQALTPTPIPPPAGASLSAHHFQHPTPWLSVAQTIYPIALDDALLRGTIDFGAVRRAYQPRREFQSYTIQPPQQPVRHVADHASARDLLETLSGGLSLGLS